MDYSRFINVSGYSTPNISPSDIITEVEIIVEEPQHPSKNNLFGWEIVSTPIFAPNGEPIPGHKAIFRNDNGQVLQVCKESYTPTTNGRFTETIENFSNVTGYQIAALKEFEGGKKILTWLKGEVQNLAGLPAQNYLLIGNSHDSSSAFFVGQTSNIIRCANQFTERNQSLRAYHTTNNAVNIQAIERTIHHLHEQNGLLRSKMEKLDLRKFSGNERKQFIRSLLDIDNTEELSAQKQNKVLALDEAITRETADVGNNFLGLFMAVTFYTTHLLREKEKVFGNVFGNSYETNQKAMKILNQMI